MRYRRIQLTCRWPVLQFQLHSQKKRLLREEPFASSPSWVRSKAHSDYMASFYFSNHEVRLILELSKWIIVNHGVGSQFSAIWKAHPQNIGVSSLAASRVRMNDEILNRKEAIEPYGQLK